MKILYRLNSLTRSYQCHIGSIAYRLFMFTSNEIVFRVLCVGARRVTLMLASLSDRVRKRETLMRHVFINISAAVWYNVCVSNRERCYCFRRAQLGKKNKQCEQQTQIPDAVSAAASNNSDSRNFRLKTLRLQLNMNPSTLNLRYIR